MSENAYLYYKVINTAQDFLEQIGWPGFAEVPFNTSFHITERFFGPTKDLPSGFIESLQREVEVWNYVVEGHENRFYVQPQDYRYVVSPKGCYLTLSVGFPMISTARYQSQGRTDFVVRAYLSRLTTVQAQTYQIRPHVTLAEFPKDWPGDKELPELPARLPLPFAVTGPWLHTTDAE